MENGAFEKSNENPISPRSKQEFISALQETDGMLQQQRAILWGTLQRVRPFSASVSQLLEEYNRRLQSGTSASMVPLRQLLVKRVQREIDECRAALDSNLNPPDRGTIKIRHKVSQKQLVANRKNALRSTGPKTPQGKRSVRQNALKHGLLSHPVVALSAEELDEFENWRSKLRSWIRPKNEAEERLASNAAVLIWKLGRCIRAQGSLLSTPESADRGQTLHRYAGSLHRQLREIICEFMFDAMKKEVAMSDGERKWDLLTDGVLWKAAASAVADPELRKHCENVVGWLQEKLDRTYGPLLIIADCAAAASYANSRCWHMRVHTHRLQRSIYEKAWRRPIHPFATQRAMRPLFP